MGTHSLKRTLHPLSKPDLGPLDAAAKSLAQVPQPGQLIVLESTTYPGTTAAIACRSTRR